MRKPAEPGESDIEALCISDLHLDHNIPGARQAPFVNWYEVQAKYLKQLAALSKKYNNAPILAAGDILDNPVQPPEFINFLLIHLPHLYAVPGNHDLPNYNFSERYKSTYQTLVEAGRITNLEPGMPIRVGRRLVVQGFPCGFPVQAFDKMSKEVWEEAHVQGKKNLIHTALVHSYIWKKDCGHPKASEKEHQKAFIPRLDGYRCAVFGDNHMGFLSHRKNIDILNCGAFIRRSMAEVDYTPKVGLIHKSGRISTVDLDCADDKFITKERANVIIQGTLDLAQMVSKMTGMGVCVFDYVETLLRWCQDNAVEKIVQDLLIEAATRAKRKERESRRLDE